MSSNLKVFKNQRFTSGEKEERESKFYGKNALGFAWRPGQEEFELLIDSCVIDGAGVAEGLKLSFCRNVRVLNTTIIGGYEDCVDIVRGSNITFENCKFISSKKTKQHITCKGGAQGVSFINCQFINAFRHWWNGACIDLGNWTDYDDVDRPKTRNILIKNCKLSGVLFPVLYRKLYSECPKVYGSNGLGFSIPGIFVKIFWFIQRKNLFGNRRRFGQSNLKVFDIEK